MEKNQHEDDSEKITLQMCFDLAERYFDQMLKDRQSYSEIFGPSTKTSINCPQVPNDLQLKRLNLPDVPAKKKITVHCE